MRYDPWVVLANQAFIKAPETNTSWVGAADSAVPQAINDDFYKFDRENITQYALGDILNVREVGLAGYNYSKAWQILYRSENTFGDATATVTTVVLPNNVNNTDEALNVISYQLYEDAAFLDCSPSYSLLTSKPNDHLQNILDQGYILNYPDHEGKNSSFTAGPLEGKLTLDSLRAVKKAQNITGVEAGKAILWGYSGGSIATGWAAELQSWYAPELDISANIVGGFVVDLLATVALVNGTPLVGFVPPGLLGLAAEYPDLMELASEQIKPNLTEKASKALTQCTLDDITLYAGMNVFDFFKDGDAILHSDVLQSVAHNTTLGTQSLKVPLLVYNGIQDQIAPIGAVDKAVTQYCDNGGKVKYVRLSYKDHYGASSEYDPTVLSSFADIFAGKVWDSCSVEGLAIGDYGNNTVPQPLNSTNSTGSSNATESGAASGSANGTQTSVASGSKTVSGSAPTGKSTGKASSTSASGSETSSGAKSSNAGAVNGISGLLGLAIGALALL